MPSVTPFLWFDNNLAEAVAFYKATFPDAAVSDVQQIDSRDAPGPDSVTLATFEILGQKFMGLNGGPGHPLTDAFSLFLSVQNQAEVDHYWQVLTADGGEPGPCGWLKDKFGVSWQVIPEALGEYLGGSDEAGARRAMAAMMTMSKLDIAGLKAAYEGS